MIDSRTRLHISPFDHDLLNSIIPSSSRSSASNISFHSIQTFPENNYGFVDLPVMDAEKLKKKLNGSILKGKKMRIENAKPQIEITPVEDPAEEQPESQKKVGRTKSRKSKEEDGVLPGVELPDQRRVKRGWTDHHAKEAVPKKRKKEEPKSQPSKYTQKDEVLFQVNIPPNKSSLKVESGKKKNKKLDKNQAVVHEFSNTIKHPTFLRKSGDVSQKKITKKYDEERGWVDEDGNVNEGKPNKATGRSNPSGRESEAARKDSKPLSEDDTSSDGDETSSDGASDEEAEGIVRHDSTDNSASEQPDNDEHVSDNAEDKPTQTPLTSETDSKDQHPLEALFKRPKSKLAVKPSLEVNTTFTFFEPDEEGTKPPHTPFTVVDRRERDLRSAAPTPDTPAPGKTSFSARQLRTRLADHSLGAKDRRGLDSTSVAPETSSKRAHAGSQNEESKPEESEFAKWFWENRGDTNRTWKRRRREAAKEERQRENRKRAGK